MIHLLLLTLYLVTSSLLVLPSQVHAQTGQSFGTTNYSCPGGQPICTADVKQCPDGSTVSRTGCNCEFAACPGENETPPAASCQPKPACLDATNSKFLCYLPEPAEGWCPASPAPSPNLNENQFSPADLNQDGQRTLVDYALFVQLFKTHNAGADINSDNQINLLDYALFIQAYRG